MSAITAAPVEGIAQLRSETDMRGMELLISVTRDLVGLVSKLTAGLEPLLATNSMQRINILRRAPPIFLATIGSRDSPRGIALTFKDLHPGKIHLVGEPKE